MKNLQKYAFKKLKESYDVKTTATEKNNFSCLGNKNLRVISSHKTFNYDFKENKSYDKVVSNIKYVPYVEAQRLKNTINKMKNSRMKHFLSQLKSKGLYDKLSKGANKLENVFKKDQFKDFKAMLNDSHLKDKAQKKVKQLARGLILLNLGKTGNWYSNLYKNAKLAMKVKKNLKLAKLNKLKILIREWRLFIEIKKETYNKYMGLYSDMWNIYSKELFNTENEEDLVNKEQLFYKLFDDTETIKRESQIIKENLLNKKVKKKDYLTLKVLKDFEDYIEHMDETPTDIYSISFNPTIQKIKKNYDK